MSYEIKTVHTDKNGRLFNQDGEDVTVQVLGEVPEWLINRESEEKQPKPNYGGWKSFEELINVDQNYIVSVPKEKPHIDWGEVTSSSTYSNSYAINMDYYYTYVNKPNVAFKDYTSYTTS